MATPNISELATVSIQHRNREIVDNILGNNALLAVIRDGDHANEIDGGETILEEHSFAENNNAGWYSGLDILPTGHNDTLTAAEFPWKQLACPVLISGLDEIKNSGRERMINLVKARSDVAISTLLNLFSAGLYSDGTGQGGKQLTGLLAAVPVDPTTGTYGGINAANYPYWRSYALDTNAAPAAATIQGFFNTAWANLVRGKDHPDLIAVDATVWAAYMASLQPLQRFTDPQAKLARLGFSTVKYMQADVVMDGGIGGDAVTATAFFLNTKYLYLKVFGGRNMVPLKERGPYNQDASVTTIAWAGNLTCSFRRAQGQILFS